MRLKFPALAYEAKVEAKSARHESISIPNLPMPRISVPEKVGIDSHEYTCDGIVNYRFRNPPPEIAIFGGWFEPKKSDYMRFATER